MGCQTWIKLGFYQVPAAASTRGSWWSQQFLNLTAPLASPAVKVKGEYVVAGKGKTSLNVTYPSALEDKQIKYQVFLTQDNLPSLEEIHMDGPTQEEIEIQVNWSSRVGRGAVRGGLVWVALLHNPGVLDSGDCVSKAGGDGFTGEWQCCSSWEWLPTGFLQLWGWLCGENHTELNLLLGLITFSAQIHRVGALTASGWDWGIAVRLRIGWKEGRLASPSFILRNTSKFSCAFTTVFLSLGLQEVHKRIWQCHQPRHHLQLLCPQGEPDLCVDSSAGPVFSDLWGRWGSRTQSLLFMEISALVWTEFQSRLQEMIAAVASVQLNQRKEW